MQIHNGHWTHVSTDGQPAGERKHKIFITFPAGSFERVLTRTMKQFLSTRDEFQEWSELKV